MSRCLNDFHMIWGMTPGQYLQHHEQDLEWLKQQVGVSGSSSRKGRQMG